MAEFGTPETWNMKVGDFIETQLPQEKPQALLDLQEQNRKQRLLQSLQKIGPGLMDESLDFIRRENFRLGTMPSDVKGPFPGYESKPGKYAVRTKLGSRELSLSQLKNVPGFVRKSKESIFFDTKADAKKFLNSELLENLYQKSAFENPARGSRAFKRTNPALFKKIIQLAESGDFGPTAIGRHPDVVKLNKGKNIIYGTIKNVIEAEKGEKFFKDISKLKSTFKSDARLSLEKKLPQLKADYLDGMSTIKLTEKYLPDSKARSSTTLESVLKDMQAGKLPTKITKAELAKRPDLTGTSGGQVIKKDPKKLAAIIEDIPKMANKEIQEKYNINSTTLNEIKNEYGLEFGKKLPPPKDPKVTERLNKVLKTVKSADLPLGSIKGDSPVAKKLADKAGMGVREFLVDVNRIRQDPTRLNLSKEDVKLLSRFPDPGFTEGLLQVKGYSPKTVKAVRAVERASSSVTEAGSQLEHALPKALIKQFNLPRKYLLTAERTTNFLNQFKKQFDNQLINAAKKHAAGEISYPEYKREVARITKIVSDKTGGYKMGYVDFKDGKPFAVTPQETLLKGEGDLGKKTKGLKNYFKNAIYHNKLYDNYTKNPDDPAFGTLREEIKQGKYNFVKEVEAENTAKAINNFTKPEEFFSLYQKDPDNIFFKALSKTAGLAGGRGKLLLAGGATLPLLTTALAAETGNEIEDDSILPETAVATAAVAPLATKKGRSIYGTAGKGLLKALQTLGTPFGVVAGEALIPGGVRSQLQEEGLEQTLRNPLSYAGLPLASLGAEAVKNPALQRALNLGLPLKAIRAGTPIGLGLMGVSALVDSALKFQEEFDALSPEEQKQYLKEQEEFGEDIQGAAEGGIMRLGFAEGPDKKGLKSPGRRKFMKDTGKLAGILALIPYLGKFLAPVAKSPAAVEGIKLGADKLMMLVDKIKKFGVDKTKNRATQDLQEVTVYQGKDGSEYELVEDLATGDVRVTKEKPGMGSYGDETFDTIEDRSVFEIKKGRGDETTKGTPPDEYEEAKEVFGPEGTVDDIDEIDDRIIKEIDDEIN